MAPLSPLQTNSQGVECPHWNTREFHSAEKVQTLRDKLQRNISRSPHQSIWWVLTTSGADVLASVVGAERWGGSGGDGVVCSSLVAQLRGPKPSRGAPCPLSVGATGDLRPCAPGSSIELCLCALDLQTWVSLAGSADLGVSRWIGRPGAPVPRWIGRPECLVPLDPRIRGWR